MKTLKMYSLILLIVFGFMPAAMAADDLLSDEYQTCMSQSENMTTIGMVECMQAEQQRHKIKLEAAYQKLMETMPEGQREMLEKSQNAWLLYQEAHSDFVYYSTGGSIKQILTAGFYMRSTAQRAQELEDTVKDFGME